MISSHPQNLSPRLHHEYIDSSLVELAAGQRIKYTVREGKRGGAEKKENGEAKRKLKRV